MTVPPITIHERVRGPLSQRSFNRAALVAGAAWVVGLAPSALGMSPALRAAGLGLVAPGAGLIYTADPILFVLAVVATAVALQRLLLKGDNIAPLIVIAGAMVVAALRASGTSTWSWAAWAVPAVVAAAVGIGAVLRGRALRAAQQRGRERNARLAETTLVLPAADPQRDRELSEDELAFHRWMLDRALQPPDRWESFDWKDQYSLRGVRYQLNFLQWALALAQHSRTPAFAGYATAAQRNLIQRMTDRRIWSYWSRENLWGNFAADPNPITRDNIMFSGYLALMLGTYAAASGDRHFDRPGSLVFRWDDARSFVYDRWSVVDAVERNFIASDWGLFPCEPGLVFPLCNTVALLGSAMRGGAAATDGHRALLPRFRKSLEEEFTAADGDLAFYASPRFGVVLRAMRSAHLTAQHGFFLRPLFPDLADRHWAIARREIVDSEKYAPAALGRADRITGDWGTGKASHAGMYATLMMLARELGDGDAYERVAEAAAEHLRYATRDGVGCYEACSIVTNGWFGLARFGRADAWRELIDARPQERRGPRLADAAYPDVLVARATTDGHVLDLVLRPGNGARNTTLCFDGLRPGQPYVVRGAEDAEITAGADGAAAACVGLTGRTELQVAPA